MEADFQQFYGINVWVLVDEDLWRAARLAECLPPEARVRQGKSVNNQWMKYTDQLLTVTVNLLKILVWQNTKDGAKGRNQPEPVPLPEQLLKDAERNEKNAARARALHERLARRRRGEG